MNYIDETAGASAPSRHSPLSVAVPEDAHRQLMGKLQSSHPVLLHWMHRKLGDRELATDLMNHAVVSALEQQHSGRLHCRGDIAGHVFKIGMNLLRQQQLELENRPHLHLTGGTAPPVSREASTETGHDERLKQGMRHLLESLSSQRDRQIVTQFYLGGVDKESLCRQFSVSSQQFNAIVSLVRQRMKAMLEAGART